MPKPTKDEPKATRKKGLTEGTKAKSNTKKRANESAPPKKCAAAPKARRTKAQQPGLSEEERTVTFNRGTIPLLYHSPSFDVDMQHFMLRTALEQPHLKCEEIDDKTAAEGYTNSKEKTGARAATAAWCAAASRPALHVRTRRAPALRARR